MEYADRGRSGLSAGRACGAGKGDLQGDHLYQESPGRYGAVNGNGHHQFQRLRCQSGVCEAGAGAGRQGEDRGEREEKVSCGVCGRGV